MPWRALSLARDQAHTYYQPMRIAGWAALDLVAESVDHRSPILIGITPSSLAAPLAKWALRRGPFPAGATAGLSLLGICGPSLAPPTPRLQPVERILLAAEPRALGILCEKGAATHSSRSNP
jgi:hypothetical protein